MTKLVIHESEGEVSPDICGIAVEIVNPKSAGSKNLSFAKLIIRPGEKSQRHYHAKMEEIYYILNGHGKIIIDGKSYSVMPGHAIFLPVGARHQIFNTGKSDLIFVCADSPAYEDDDVFESE